ncbi:adenylate cyclase [Enhydrobacter aerosaccus]|uniref:Adenylate cyclase n=1 Tax=Enhydrobacter aerosaccus TaxID=225324 RepID=A0A1T4S6N8_9HYPH|nr:adenylate/guanylate cyclase domain-containing protein [Enhydrobacter aerosaccus]SKA23924.1 adenylate cyclase [Enhydrobacter aerosaccus]
MPDSGASATLDWKVEPVVDWLVHEGRLIADPGRLVEELANRMVAAGAPLLRFTIGLQAIHPQWRSFAIQWRRGEKVQLGGRPHGIETTSAYIGSPMQELAETRRPVRYRLDGLTENHHEVLHEIAAAGGTDYYAAPMRVAYGRSPALTFTTDRPDGFSEADLAKFHRLMDYLAPVFESRINQRLATTLLDTYLGRIVGEQIMGGLIKRGDGREINAVLWFSDLRDFTGLNERMASGDLIELLNNYLQLVGDALTKHGGEILKFIGDGVMAYFPAEDALFLPMVTANALGAARQLIDDIGAANEARAAGGHEPLRFGIGLHIGPVTFGNVGTEDRLDFTVIGPAVNRAARLESLTKETGVPVLASAEFKDATTQPMVSMGKHTLRGVPEPVEVFTLP